jgi:hypothetical protein
MTGIVLSTPFLVWMSYMEQSERTTAVVLLVTYWTVQSLNNAGFRVNHIDIAPRYERERRGGHEHFFCYLAAVTIIGDRAAIFDLRTCMLSTSSLKQ